MNTEVELAESAIPAVRVERAVVALAMHAQQIEDRLERLETRLADALESGFDYATVDDVLDARVHAARLAGEMARINVEWRCEVQRLDREVRSITHDPERHRAVTLAESIIELSDRMYGPGPLDVPRSYPVPDETSPGLAESA